MLTTSVERLEGNAVKLTVTVSADEVDAAINASFKDVASKVRLPGFRPGKAPKPMIENAVGRDYILAEATESLVQGTYSRALDQENLRPIESPELEELETVEAGADYTYSAEIDIRPELTLSDADNLEIALPQREATQEEVDMQLDVAREQFASLEPVEDRGVEVDDYVLLSFVGLVDGEPYEGNTIDKYLYEMNRGLMPPEFDEGILGAKPGEERQVEFVIPETSTNTEFIGKTASFAITVHEIKAKRIPEIDDAFAGNLGFDTAEELIADLKSRIDLQKGESHDRLRERRIRELLASRLEGDIPESMVVSRQSTMMRDFFTMLENRDMQIEKYLEMTGVTMDQLEADMKEQALQSVREDLGLEAFFRAKGFEITEADIDEELAVVAEAGDSSPEEARKRWAELGLMPIVRDQVMHRKATEYLLENVKVVEEAPAAESDDGEAGTKKAAPKKRSRAKKADAENTETEE